MSTKPLAVNLTPKERCGQLIGKLLHWLAPTLFPKFCPTCLALRFDDGEIVAECDGCWYERRCELGFGGKRNGWPGGK